MLDVDIFINDELADISDAEKLKFAVTYSIAEIQKLNKRQSAHTTTITLPLTATNKKIFGFVDDINSTEGLDQRVQPTARVEVNGTEILKGIAKVVSPEIGEGIRINLLGDNSDWHQQLKEKNLQSLDLSSEDHDYLTTSIIDSWTFDPSLRKYVYPLINYGGLNLIKNGVPVVNVEDMHPAVHIRSLVEKIFQEIGYKINSEFLNSDFFNRLFLPFTNETFIAESGFTDDKLFRAKTSADLVTTEANKIVTFDDITGDGFDDGSNLGTLSFAGLVGTTYTVTENAIMDFIFEGELEILLAAQNTRVGIHFVKNGTLATGTRLTGWLHQFVSLPNVGDKVKYKRSTGFINVFVGDVISVYIESNRINDITKLNSGAVFYNRVKSVMVAGQNVSLEENLPDETQLSFMQGLKHLFNLYFVTDPITRTVTMEPEDDFYLDTSENWTDKIALDKKMSLKFLGNEFKREITFSYKDDSSDVFVTEFNRQNKFVLASEDVELENKFSQKGTTILDNPFFASTIMDIAPEINFITTKIPKMWNELMTEGTIPNKNTEYTPRILFYNDAQPIPSGEEWTIYQNIESGESIDRQTIYPNFYSVEEVVDNQNSLYFNDSFRSNGLFQKFYRNHIETINKSRLLTIWLNLSESDISKFASFDSNGKSGFQIPIFIDSTKAEIRGNYRVNKIINYTPNRITKVELLRIVSDAPLNKITTIADDPRTLPTGPVVIGPFNPVGPVPVAPTTGSTPKSPSTPSGTGTGSTAQTGMPVSAPPNETTGAGGVTMGTGLNNPTEGGTVIGTFNDPKEGDKLQIGGGDTEIPSNVIAVDEDSNFRINGDFLLTTVGGQLVTCYYTSSRDSLLHPVVIGASQGIEIGDAPFVFQAETITFENAVIANGGSLTAAEKSAIDIYIIDAKNNTDAWFNDTIADYPLVGASSFAHAINLKTPGTFDLIFVNTLSGDHTSNGFQLNGSSSYARTGIIPSASLTLNSVALEVYSRTNIAENAQDLACNTIVLTQRLTWLIRSLANVSFFDAYDVTGGRHSETQTSSLGGFLANRLSPTDSRLFRNGLQYGIAINTSGGTQPTHELYLGANNGAGTAAAFASKELAGAGVFNGLTPAQALAQYTARQTLNTSLSRNV